MIQRGNRALTSQAKNKLTAAQTQMERSILNITYMSKKRQGHRGD